MWFRYSDYVEGLTGMSKTLSSLMIQGYIVTEKRETVSSTGRGPIVDVAKSDGEAVSSLQALTTPLSHQSLPRATRRRRTGHVLRPDVTIWHYPRAPSSAGILRS